MHFVRTVLLLWVHLCIARAQTNVTCRTNALDYGLYICALTFGMPPGMDIQTEDACENLECYLDCIQKYLIREATGCTPEEYNLNNSLTTLSNYGGHYRYTCAAGQMGIEAMRNCFWSTEDTDVECHEEIVRLDDTAAELFRAGDMEAYAEVVCRSIDLQLDCAVDEITDLCTTEMANYKRIKTQLVHLSTGCVSHNGSLPYIEDYIYPAECLTDYQNSTLVQEENFDGNFTLTNEQACINTMAVVMWNCGTSFLQNLISTIEGCKTVECRLSCFVNDPQTQVCLTMIPDTINYVNQEKIYNRMQCDKPALYFLAWSYCDVSPCHVEFLQALSAADNQTWNDLCVGRPLELMRTCVPFTITPDCDEEMIEHATFIWRLDYDRCFITDLPQYTYDTLAEGTCDGSAYVKSGYIIVWGLSLLNCISQLFFENLVSAA